MVILCPLREYQWLELCEPDMARLIRITKTFLFYDFPQVFAAEDQQFRTYLGFLHEDRLEGPLFLLAEFQPARLESYQVGSTTFQDLIADLKSNDYWILNEIPCAESWVNIFLLRDCWSHATRKP